MLYYTFLFLIFAFIAGFFGFGGLSVAFAGIAKTLFFVFVLSFVASLVLHFARKVDHKTGV